MAEHHTLRLVTLWVLREGGEMGESEVGEGKEETFCMVRLLNFFLQRECNTSVIKVN